MSRYNIARNLFAPKRRAFAALYNPAAPSSLIGTQIVRKNVALNGLIVGANNVVVNTGHIRIESLFIIVNTTASSGGAPTLAVGIPSAANYFCPPVGLANLVANAQLGTLNANAQAPTPSGIADPIYEEVRAPGAIANVSFRGPCILSNGGAIVFTVATALYTGGSIDIFAVYTPLSAGATLA